MAVTMASDGLGVGGFERQGEQGGAGRTRSIDMVLLWRMYVDFELRVNGDAAAAKRVFLRAVRRCPGSKRLWLEGGIALRPYMGVDEARLFVNMMANKELLLREELKN
jgi:hypothetical protein